MQIKIKIPENLSEISLKKYQKYIEISKNSQDTFFLMQKCISIFCEIDMATVLTFRYTDVEIICAQILSLFEKRDFKFIERFTLNGVEFGFIPHLEAMTVGEFPDIDNNLHDIDKLHKAMAVLYRPITKRIGTTYEIEKYQGTDNYSEVMKFAPLDVVFGAKVFFWNLGNDLLSSSLNFLSIQMKKQEFQISEEVTAGIVASINSLKEMSLKFKEQPKFL